ncbi:MAG TPA: hypothetical protein ENK55_03770, partial [Actinobacteria bacterium]|nr:hypothetical protein [Actinomycetota bacterium]
ALGAGYESGPPVVGPVVMKGGGPFGWEPGEWTDDTQMAICIAEEAATGDFDLVSLGDRFIAWAREARNVGNQTRAVLSQARNGGDLPRLAADYHRAHPERSAGNGSLMRTAAVALVPSDDPARLAAEVSALTHADPRAVDACILWTLAVRRSMEAGELVALEECLDALASERRDDWAGIIEQAEVEPPSHFVPNGYVVTALQAAWSSIVHTRQYDDPFGVALEAAVSIGDDTDTIAAIAGSLLGAAYGAAVIDPRWLEVLHGWPGLDAEGLRSLARKAAGVG